MVVMGCETVIVTVIDDEIRILGSDISLVQSFLLDQFIANADVRG